MLSKDRNSLSRGIVLALLSAICFGLVIPFVAQLGRGVGPFATAALLYAGAAFSSLAPTAKTTNEVSLRWGHLPRLLVVAAFGSVIAPVLLAWGLQHANATTASLVLNGEAIFTVLLARAFYREPLGLRVKGAVVIMFVGGALLVLPGGTLGSPASWGTLAVLAAAVSWALDNTLTRPMTSVSPRLLTIGKAGIGAAASFCLAIAAREPFPDFSRWIALICCGALGYGVSLRLYLSAQRVVGAARTASVFATAPFVGAAVGWAMGSRAPGWGTLPAALLFAFSIYLHLTERHRHAHRHEPIEHEHTHRHDDLHHDHHDVPTRIEHSHWHRHEMIEHEHPHAFDAHHQHEH